MSRAALVGLKTFGDARGHLVVLQPGDGALTFEARRVFYIHGVPPGGVRGRHAHREVEQLMVAVAGKFEVELDDGHERNHYTLNDPTVGLKIPRLTWCEMSAFAPGAVCLVLASEPYVAADYIRDYTKFRLEVEQLRAQEQP